MYVYHSALSPIGRRWGREASDFAAQLQSVWPERPLGPHQRRPNLPSSWLQASVQRRHEGNLLGRSGFTDPLLFHLFRWANCPENKLSNVRIILLVPSKKFWSFAFEAESDEKSWKKLLNFLWACYYSVDESENGEEDSGIVVEGAGPITEWWITGKQKE